MGANNSSEIRGDRKAEALGTLAGWLMRGLSATWRFEIVDRGGALGSDSFPPPAIFAMWHSGIVAVPPAWMRSGGRHRKTVVLTSASKDGATLASAMAVFGLGAVRGSSSRRGAAALVAMKRALAAGSDLCITPDGPRGPLHHCHPGAVKMAEATGTPIVPILVHCESAWRLRTWDRLMIPKPFSRVRIVFDTMLVVPPRLDEAAFQAECERLRAALLATP